jgi:hypothetical protein
MTFYLTIVPNMDHGTDELECQSRNPNCQIRYYRTYTPRVHYLSPPVVYQGSKTQVWFDAKDAYRLVEDLQEDEMYFINAKIGGFALDFEETVAFDDSIGGYGGIAHWNVVGNVGELPAGNLYDDFSMLWEVGNSYTDTP